MSAPAPLPVAILVTCFNRIGITLPNLQRLVYALNAANETYQLHVLDDASPDSTGAIVADGIPLARVTQSEGNLFWNRGMHRLFNVAREQGPFAGYLLFNDDVAVDPAAVRRIFADWREVNASEPTTLVGATRETGGSRITYSGLRLVSRHRPLSTRMVQPNGEYQVADTFNANFALVPARTMEEIGGTDPFYHHSFGDIDLGLSIKARGEQLRVGPEPIGECDDRAHGVPSRHGLLKRLHMGFVGKEDPRQHMHLIYKHAPNKLLATGVIGIMLVRRLLLLVRNGPHVMPGGPNAKPGF